MSFNTTEVNNQKPNASGVIQLSLDNIITVNSPVTDQVLQKDSSDWKTSSLNNSVDGLLSYYDDDGLGRTYYYYDEGDVYDMRKVSGEFTTNEFEFVTSSGSYVSRSAPSLN